MKVFLSWSGVTSRALAEALHDWLPRVLQAVRPWLSSSDLQAGVRWSADVARELEETSFGILCLTPDNLEAPWIMFEAGALSKVVHTARVVPYLLGIEPSDLKGPLAQFQAVRAVPDNTLKLLRTLNVALGERSLMDEQLSEAFEVWWPRLERRLTEVVQETARSLPPAPKRSPDDILTEILQLLRAQERRAQQAAEDRAAAVERQVLQLQAIEDAEELTATDRLGDGNELDDLSLGARVQHRRFGSGSIVRASGRGRDRRVMVEFDDPEHGIKQLLVAYAGLKLLSDTSS